MHELQPETVLSHYRILSKIGAGGMGEVYLALDTRLDRKVALKILPGEFASNQDRMKRFVQEAKAASALNHPNIITIYEINRANSTYFIATEFIEGETLRQRIRVRSMKTDETLDIAIQVASSLASAHAAHILHRDIKPENIMIRSDGFVKVLDFGLAKLTADQNSDSVDAEAATRPVIKTEPGLVMGTVFYMSPEQARGLHLDGRTDIFSLGVVLYEMITGSLPFIGPSSSEVLAEILNDKEPPPLARFTRDVPPEFERIVEKALRKNPEERYQSAKDLLLDLKSLKQRLAVDAAVERSQAPALKHSGQIADSSSVQEVSSAPNDTGARLATSPSDKRSLVAILIAVLLLSLAAVTYYFYSTHPGSNAPIDSIAVIPFANTSNNPNTEYLSDGISEALINSLTELQRLRVIARATAFRYKGKQVDPQGIGHDLNVRAVLMGSVRQQDDNLDIQVDLVDATTGAQLWGHNYEGKVSNVLEVKQSIAKEVTERLKLRLSGEEQQRLTKRDSTNSKAYESYLKGRYFWNKRTADNLKKAIEQFQQALDQDPNFALGYVGLADSYGLLEEYAGVPASETLPKARAAADRALQIDDSLAEAHASSGFVFSQMWQWAEQAAEYKRAINLNGNYPTAHHWLSIYFRSKRQFDDSLREIQQAQKLDPLSSVIGQNVAELYLIKNDFPSAIKECQNIIELDPGFPGAHDELGYAYLKENRYGEATVEFQKAVELSGKASRYLGDLGYCFAVEGKRAEAMTLLKELIDRYNRHESIGQYVASVYAGLDNKDEAFAWLEKDVQQHSGSRVQFLVWWFSFEGLRSDPRYANMVQRIGLVS